MSEPIDLHSPLNLRNAWRFPVQSRAARQDIFIGALWLCVPVVGWLMNMGHRIRCVHRLQRGQMPWPAWSDSGELLMHGTRTALGMLFYGSPGLAALGAGVAFDILALQVVGGVLLALAVIAIPGYMSHYCYEYDAAEIFNPFRALSRVRQGGVAYWRAWAIVIPTMLFSFVGLLLFGLGFLVTSVWFWHVAAFCFASVFSKRFDLAARPNLGAANHQA